MDHLLIPKHPARSAPRIRHYCQQEYDGKDFLYYPKRMGWTYKELLNERTWFNLGLPDSERDPEKHMARWSYLGLPDGKRKVEDVLAFLQQWLFFGLLHTFPGDLAMPSDFIETDLDTGVTYVHTRNLLPLARRLLEKERRDQVLPRRGFGVGVITKNDPPAQKRPLHQNLPCSTCRKSSTILEFLFLFY